MTDPSTPRVAVYVDFDNIVISRYDQVHGRSQWQRDDARSHAPGRGTDVGERLLEAQVDVGAVLDYASSYGPVVIARAYADWSLPANAAYRQQLVNRAVDLTQLFPVTSGMKNGADIRLSVDVVEDLFRLPDLTHVVVVAGDSDYIALAQRARRLGRQVIGIGVAGSTSRALMAACDEFADYDELLVTQADDEVDDEPDATGAEPSAALQPPATPGGATAAEAAAGESADPAAAPAADLAQEDRIRQRAGTRLLMRAARLVHDKHPDDAWLPFSEVKSQMIRLDPAFSERSLGYSSFSDFVAGRKSVVEVDKPKGSGQARVRLRPNH
ncbi:NYN domain-containing protein [Cellulomonas massiliensis]|uniref:NYN domain-containing protein n=1 Tax=Cellulomonas massiliensis TaxID=1465811 RepID=UPI00031ECB5C|nr:NYN domain-containing protein [Cellulomonas massiliensis]